jgi:DNA-binding XRE family transcriptional regulator
VTGPGADHLASPDEGGPQPGPRELRRVLGQRLKAARNAAGLSQQQLARAVGYTRSGVSSAESGGYAARHFYALCDDVLKTSGTLAAGYDAMSQHLADAQAAGTTAEFGDPRMKVVVGYVRGSWHIELYLPDKPG